MQLQRVDDVFRPTGSRRTHNCKPGDTSVDGRLKDPGAIMNSLERQHHAHKGVWEVKKIANPVFEDDDLVYQY